MFESYFSQVVVAVSFLTCLRNFKAMSNRLSNEKRGWILKEYSKPGNAAEVRRNWTLTFSTPAPTPRTIYRIRDKFNATGSVRNVPPPGRPKSVCTEENTQLVTESFAHNPCNSIRRSSLELGIPRSSILRMLKDVGWKPFRPRLVHGLLQSDTSRY